jgi:hypothetical protein
MKNHPDSATSNANQNANDQQRAAGVMLPSRIQPTQQSTTQGPNGWVQPTQQGLNPDWFTFHNIPAPASNTTQPTPHRQQSAPSVTLPQPQANPKRLSLQTPVVKKTMSRLNLQTPVDESATHAQSSSSASSSSSATHATTSSNSDKNRKPPSHEPSAKRLKLD